MSTCHHNPLARKGIVQALVHEVKKHTEGIDADVRVTNERIGVLEATQLATDTKLGTMEASVARIDNNLAALLKHFDNLMTREHDRHQGHNNNNTMMNRSMTIGMSILLIQNFMTTMLAVRYSIITMAGVAIDDVRYATVMMFFINSSLKYHLLMASMILMLIFPGNWLLNKNLHASNFLKMLGLEPATSEFSDFASVCWVEYGKKHPNDIPQTWIALRQVMQARFVPSYYARDLINKLQQLKQGAKSVEEYYQELQIGMLRCNLEKREDAAMSRFVAGLNHEIQDILEYKDYVNITRLFHFACKAEREVQGHHAGAKTNFSAGRTNSW
jgi:hypothetical protein